MWVYFSCVLGLMVLLSVSVFFINFIVLKFLLYKFSMVVF